MDRETQLWNLYKHLKDEIIQSDTRNTLLLTLIVTATGAILSLGFGQDNPERPWVILCVYIFIIPVYGVLYGNRKNIWRISTYLRVFIEPKLEEVKWETRIDEQRRNAQKTKHESLSSGIITNEFKLVTALSLITLIALLVNSLQLLVQGQGNGLGIASLDFDHINSIIALLIGFILFVSFYIKGNKSEKELRRTGKVETEYFESWKTLNNPK